MSDFDRHFHEVFGLFRKVDDQEAIRRIREKMSRAEYYKDLSLGWHARDCAHHIKDRHPKFFEEMNAKLIKLNSLINGV